MTDIATCRDRSILGISIQFLANEKHRVVCLGMCEFKARRTAQNIKVALWDCLNEYDVPHEQIISITSDNASNMTAMIKIFDDKGEDEELELNLDSNAPEQLMENNTIDSGNPIDQLVEGENEAANPYQDSEILEASCVSFSINLKVLSFIFQLLGNQ